MKRAGKGSIWEYRKNGKFVVKGTQEEIAEELNVKVSTLRIRCTNLKNHEMILIKDSRPTYKMVNDEGVIAEGTIKEITKNVPYSYSHVINVARGERKSKDFELIKIG